MKTITVQKLIELNAPERYIYLVNKYYPNGIIIDNQDDVDHLPDNLKCFINWNWQETGLYEIDLSGANLSKANLSGADLSGANLSKANLSGADLSKTDLYGADLNEADLSWADLSGANLSWADLSGANLSKANLSGANLSWADLSGANLSKANLSGADLNEADLSKAKNLIDPIAYIKANFECIYNGDFIIGFYAYKTFNNKYPKNKDWIISPGSVIKEVVNQCPTIECGCGINVAKKDWNGFGDNELWKVKVLGIQMLTVTVPYNTDGKIRVGECELVEIVI